MCLPGARIEHVTERVEKIMGRGNGVTLLVHVGTNNTDKEGTTAIVEKYRKLLKLAVRPEHCREFRTSFITITHSRTTKK